MSYAANGTDFTGKNKENKKPTLMGPHLKNWLHPPSNAGRQRQTTTCCTERKKTKRESLLADVGGMGAGASSNEGHRGWISSSDHSTM
jgi:hypothetical protein